VVLALPYPAWLRLGAKAARGLVLAWGFGLLGSLTYMVQDVLAHSVRPGAEFDQLYGVAVTSDARVVLYLALLAVPLALVGAGLGLWAVRLRHRPTAWWGWVLTVLILLVGVVGATRAFRASGGALWGAFGLVAAALWWWASRWLREGAEVPGAGRG